MRFTDHGNLMRHRRSHMDEELHTWSKPHCKRSLATRQFKLDAVIQSSADQSFQLVSSSSTCDMDKPHESLSVSMHLDSNEKRSPLAKITKIKSLDDAEQFMEKSFGCGICDEMLENEKVFLEHCSVHSLATPDNFFIGRGIIKTLICVF